MIKEYAFNDNTQLTEHFNIQEFRCKCGQNHPIKHNPALSEKLEKLFERLNCSKIIVNSGHRCSQHDVSVGGSGKGHHIEGNAADVVCYDKNGQKISSKLVSCAAQDLQFGGIANIDKQYNATHVDVRTDKIWYGDEVVTTASSVTDDFYSYYDIKKETSELCGIDVSEWQGNIDWASVKTDFVILRAGYGKEASQKDKCFEENYKRCKENGIHVGAYWYSYATSVEEAQQEANVFLSTIKRKQFEYPVYMDVEEQRQFTLGKKKVSEIIRAFCSVLEKAGYFVGLYMSASFLDKYVEDDVKKAYTVWVANYGVDKPNYTGDFGMWQFTNSGYVSGVNGNVDMNYCYKDFPSIIKNAGLNGFGSEVKQTKKSVNVKIEIDDHEYSGLLEEV